MQAINGAFQHVSVSADIMLPLKQLSKQDWDTRVVRDNEGQHVKRICVATNGAHGNYVVTTTPGAQPTRQCGDLLESPNALSTKKHHSIIFQAGRCCTNEDDGTSDDECDNHVNAVFERVQMIAMVLVILATALTQTIVLLLRAVVVLVLAALVMLTMVMLCFAIS